MTWAANDDYKMSNVQIRDMWTIVMGEKEAKYMNLTLHLYGAIDHWRRIGRLPVLEPLRPEAVPDVADTMICKLLGYADYLDLVDNLTVETQETLERFGGRNPNEPPTEQQWVFFKILEARAP